MNKFTRRTVIAAACAAAAMTFAPMSFAQQAPEKKDVTIAVGGKSLYYYLPLSIAEQLGYFKDEGLNVKIVDFQGGSRSLQAVVGGSADVVSGAFEHTISMQAKKQPMTAFVLQGRAPQLALVVSNKTMKDYKQLSDLKGKKVAMTWAYSPSYGKPLSVPQGVIGLFTRFGMDVTLAHPEGYDVFPEVEEIARKNCEKYGSKFHKTNSMAEAFKDADIVYPKSWAPFAAMEKRTNLYAEGDADGIKALEKELLAQNADHKDWCCTEELMKTTKDGKALYLHCLPADINDVSCKDGEVEASVFDRYRTPLYKEASYKPYIIAAMIFLAQVKDPVRALMAMDEGKEQRKSF